MVVIAKELLQYEKDYIKYYINIPKLYYKESDENDYIKNEMIESINQVILDDIFNFMDVVDESYALSSNDYICINSITEFQIGYVSKNIVSLAIEFSQLEGFYDISYIKGYNYDFRLKREIYLKDLFKKNVDFIQILKRYVLSEVNKFFGDFQQSNYDNLDCMLEKEICLDEENIFYFTHEYLILPFSSCQIHEELLNLLEFKIPFNKIYSYLSEYAIKNIVKKIIL